MIQELNDRNFSNSVQRVSGLFVVDFWAEWCGPCKVLSPIIDEVSTKFPNIPFGKLNVDDNPSTANKFTIRSIPTIIFFKGGEVIDKHIGSISISALEDKINKLSK